MKLGADLALDRFPADLSLGQARFTPVSAAELAAVAEVELVLPPEVLGCRAPTPTADDLRLPPPRVQATDGEALFRALGSFVARFELQGAAPVHAEPDALEAEARLGALLRGIHGLELEIRERTAHLRRS